MTTTAGSRRWCGAQDPADFSGWVADRAAGAGPHLVPVTRVGRCPQGHLAAEVLDPSTRALEDALEALGTPTEGVAVTLTVPLLELAARARSGAVVLGAVPFDAVRVDEAGAIVVADRPPGASDACTGRTSADPAADPRATACAAGVLSRVTAAARAEAAAAAASSRVACTPPPAHPLPSPRDLDGARQLVTAARCVWDRVDARSPARGTLDPVLDAARDGDARTISDALDLVVGVAPPRPVRWSRPGLAFPDEEHVGVGRLPDDTTDAIDSVARVVRDLVERGIPLGRERRVPVRHVLVGTVVAGGLVTAATGLR